MVATSSSTPPYATVDISYNPLYPRISRVGTGCEVILSHSDYNYSYITVLIGDINGDGWYDGVDAFYCSLITSGALPVSALSKAQQTAADCDHDGDITEADVALLEQAGLLLAEIDTSLSPAELENNLAYISYLELIDQSFDMVETVKEPEAKHPQGINESVTIEDFIIIIIVDFIRNYVLRLFRWIIK